MSVECYYRPGNEKHVYVETGNWDKILAEFIGMIFVVIVGGLFDLVAVILIFGCTGWVLYLFICKPIHEAYCMCNSCRRCKESAETPQPVRNLAYALESNNLSMVRKLTKGNEKEINKKIKYKSQWTYPIYIATEKGHFRIVEYLLSAGAYISTNTRNDKTLLHLACRTGNVDMMNLLIKHGCLGLYSPTHNSEPIIVKILEKGYMDSAELLVDAGYPMYKHARQITNFLPRIHDAAALSFLITALENPSSLQCACRARIRTSLGNKRIQGKLDSLSVSNGGILPEVIVKFLKLESMQTVFSVDNDRAYSVQEISIYVPD